LERAASLPTDPLLLAIESATDWLGVAVLRGAEPLARWRSNTERPGSEVLLAHIARLLGELELEPAALDAFAVSTGPGSFTGLRVGVATVKGLAFGRRDGTVAVPTLEALARVVPADHRAGRTVVAVLDARRDEFYAAGYRSDGTAVVEPRVCSARGLAGALPPGPLVLVGDGARRAADGLGGRRIGDLEVLEPPEGAPEPVAVGRLGLERLRCGRAQGADALVPFYLRRAEAEVRRTGRRFEPPTELSR